MSDGQSFVCKNLIGLDAFLKNWKTR